jgi:hypothetical protein
MPIPIILQASHRRWPLTILITLLCLLLLQFSQSVYAQQSQQPIEEQGLLKALSRKILTAVELKRELSLRGIAFVMTPAIEAEIRRRGSYLGKDDIQELLDIIRNNYRPNHRLRVSLLKYGPCEEHFEQFASLLNSKITALPSMLIRKDGRSGYTAGLKLVKEEQLSNMSLYEANQYWQRTQSLQLLQGTCVSKGNDLYVISLVFLGDLHGLLAETIRIEFKVDPSEYGETRDIHSLLILYSLAREAQLRGVSKDLIIAYLSEALGIAGQIKHLDPPELDSIRTAIVSMLRELGASNLTVLNAQQQ